MLLGRVLIDGRTGQLGVAGSHRLGLPDEVLDDVALILGEDEMLGLDDDVAQIGDQNLALLGETAGGGLQGVRLKRRVEGNVNLLVL